MTTFIDMVTARARAESLMTSTCRITTKGDSGNVTNPETGEVTTPAGATVYEGKCRVRPTATQSQDVDTGGAELARFDYLISVPFSVTAIAEEHRVLVLMSPDPALVNTLVEVRKVERGQDITARRLLCEEVR